MSVSIASRAFFLIISLLLFHAPTFASVHADSVVVRTTSNRPEDLIDYLQLRIDQMDGVQDGKINLRDSALSAYANRVYFKLVDSLKTVIDNSSIDGEHRRNYRDNIIQQLQRVNANTVYNVKQFDNVFRFYLNSLEAARQHRLNAYLYNNITQGLNYFNFLKNETGIDSFLILASVYHPETVFRMYVIYAGKNYALHVLEEASKTAPVTVKKYFNDGNPIYEMLKLSKDPVIAIILQIRQLYNRKTNAYTLIDAINDFHYTIQQADTVGNNPREYLRAMLQIRIKKNPLGAFSLEEELAVYALKYVRVINDLHLEPEKPRFASIENFSAPELYTLMVYSEEEIFTSSFNGLFKRLMNKMGDRSGFDFLNDLGDNKFRTFIKMCASYGKLEVFLRTMNPLQQQLLMMKFASGLEQYNDLSQAVEVADAFSSINDSLVLRILRSKIRYEYIRFKTANNERGAAIYGLLANLFVDKNVAGADWFSSIAHEYNLPPFDRIKNSKLFSSDSIDRWLIYFYDDEDGDASFATFIKTFTDPNWKIADSGSYVIIKSKAGLPVHIYANKPKHEYDGQEALEKIFNDSGFDPNVMVHRGHSYYAYKTIDKVKDNTEIFVLGSCGGYHSISSIIDRSPEASIISSKQIGTMFVNNPLLKLIAQTINKGQDIVWPKLWDRLAATVKSNPTAYGRFLDYIPPHKNLGAIFIKTYNKMMEEGG